MDPLCSFISSLITAKNWICDHCENKSLKKWKGEQKAMLLSL